MYVEGDVPVMSYGNNGNNGGWNDWSWIIGLAVVGGIFGNGGFGFGGGGRGNCATQADLAAGFNNSAVLSSLNDIKIGQQQAINYNNQGFAGLNNALCTLGYQNQASVNALSVQISDCCCQTQRSIDGLRYDNAKNTCDIIRAGQDNTRAILDYLTGEKISALQAENAGLKAQISNDRQSAYLLSELKPCPIPAYLTCNPNAPYGLGYGVGYGVNTHGCGASVQ